MAYLALLLALAGFLGSSLAYEARTSLPGDALYPYKIGVNENIEGLLSLSDEAKANFDLNALQARLSEAQALALRGKLDTRAQTEVTNNITSHVKDLTTLLDRMRAKGAYGEAAVFAVQLHETLSQEVLNVADISSQGSTGIELSLAPVLVKLRTTLATVALISTKIQAEAAGISPEAKTSATISSTASMGF